MITVPEAVEKIIKRSRYLSEAMAEELINTSSLARYIKPEVEEILFKDVSEASILMALKRLNTKKGISPKLKKIISSPPDMIVRSNLIALYIENSQELPEKLKNIFLLDHDKYLLNISEGISETTIVVSQNLEQKVRNILSTEKILAEFKNLSSITIRLPEETITTPGVYYFLLKSLAWERINLQEIMSSYQEVTLVFDDTEIERAFVILKSIFTEKQI